MNVDIRDAQALSALSLGALRAYLHKREWQEGERWGNRATIFTKEARGRGWEVIVPLHDTIGGYAAGMAAAIATMAVVEERSELDVFADVKEAAESFRANEPFLDEAITAQVVRLEREADDFDGRAILLYMREGHPMRLKVRFDEAAYGDVIQAFRDRCAVSVVGDIHRAGNAFELQSPRNLRILDA